MSPSGADLQRSLNLVFMAAGNARRYGSNKLLAEIEGKPMYRHVFEHLLRFVTEHPKQARLIVVSQYESILAAAREAGVAALRNHDPDEGIAGTIRLGIQAVLAANGAEQRDLAAAFFTADQPYLTYESVAAFLREAARTPAGILTASHGGVSGNPVSFDCRYFSALNALSGDTGGKAVLRRHASDVAFFELPENELQDLDRPPSQTSGELEGQHGSDIC